MTIKEMYSILKGISLYVNEIIHRYRYDLGRYTVKYLSPVSYKGHFKEIFKLYTSPLYKTPPHFYNIWDLPEWFSSYADVYGKPAALNRFQNELKWARINDAKDITYVRNPNGTYHFTDYAVKDTYMNLDYDDFKVRGQKLLVCDDVFSQGGVGGEHSEFIIDSFQDNPQNISGVYRDIQRLNPQWRLTHALKVFFPINSIIWKFLDRLGGKDFSFLLGFTPFVIEHEFGFDENGHMIPKKYNDVRI